MGTGQFIWPTNKRPASSNSSASPSEGGGVRVKLNKSLVPGGHVWDFQISADSNQVVYFADQDIPAILELYSVPLGDRQQVESS